MKTRNRINQDVYFTKNDIVKIPRSTFYRNQDIKTTFNAGLLIPLHVDEILPGDTFETQMNSVIRFSSPLIRPVMDDVEFEAWAFFVPSRLLDDNFEKIIANYQANPDWTTDVATTLSTLSIPSTGFDVQSVGDYFGLPTKVGTPNESTDPILPSDTLVSLLPFRAYTLVWDTYFRDQNLQPAITIEHAGYQALNGVATASGDYQTDAILGGALCPLNKKHDLFTSALPAPQKGAPVTLGLGAKAPINVSGDPYLTLSVKDLDGVSYGVGIGGFRNTSTTVLPFSLGMGALVDEKPVSIGYPVHSGISYADGANPNVVWLDKTNFTPTIPGTGKNFPFESHLSTLSGGSMYADLSTATGISVNDLRVLFQTQKLKEQDARYGSRYAEYLLGSWGVVSGDARLQRPEFLGKTKFTLSMQQVIQNSSSSGDSAQGNPAAYSLSGNVKNLFTKSFTEHGYLIIVGGVRISHRTYSRQVNKMWSKLSRLDFYNPVFANIGEQAIKNQEIWWDPTAKNSNLGAFGYQEAYYEYRYLPNIATGYMRPDIDESLSVWSYAEAYDSLPTLSPEWIQEDTAPIDRTLAIPTATAANFIADIYFKNKATRPMPIHSIPGLVDHSGKIIL